MTLLVEQRDAEEVFVVQWVQMCFRKEKKMNRVR